MLSVAFVMRGTGDNAYWILGVSHCGVWWSSIPVPTWMQVLTSQISFLPLLPFFKMITCIVSCSLEPFWSLSSASVILTQGPYWISRLTLERWLYESCECSEWLSLTRSFPGRTVGLPFQCFYEMWAILRCTMPKQGPLNRPAWGELQALRVRTRSAPTKQSFRDACRGKTRCSVQTLWNFPDWRIDYFFIHNTFYCTVIWRTLSCEWYKKEIGLWFEDSEPRASAWRYWWASMSQSVVLVAYIKSHHY